MAHQNRLLSIIPATKISKLENRGRFEIALDTSMSDIENAAGDLNVEKFEIAADNGDVGLLREKLSILENCYKNLVFENEKTNIDLAHERHKVGQLERKLQFVKENRSIFEKLKEAYVNMKYNQSAGRKLVEIRDKSVQTWEGILCKACLETENLRAELEAATAAYNNCVVISKEEMETINSTIQKLKDFTLNGNNDNPPETIEITKKNLEDEDKR